MSEISNYSPLSNLGFEFSVDRLPNTSFFIQTVTLPGLSLGTAEVSTPFAPLPYSGDIIFNEFTVGFLVDENLASWYDVYLWMFQLGFPSTFDQYRDLIEENFNRDFASNATLTVLDNKRQPKFRFHFENMFPISLGPLTLTINSTDVEYLVSEVVFDYKLYTVERIGL
jgi:hypothetical protein